MLKITPKTNGAKTSLKLEGKLAGAWVEELERCWHEIPTGGAVEISLEAVTYVDDGGKKLLARLYQSGAELKAEGCMTKCVVQQIISENRLNKST